MSKGELSIKSAIQGELPRDLIYSNLAVDAGISDIKLTCMEAEYLGIPRVLVNAVNVSTAARYCKNSPVKVCAALSYPVGAFPAEIKGLEIEDAINNGADEIFMLMALGMFLDGFYKDIQKEMDVLIEKANGRPAYYMIETSALTNMQMAKVCSLAKNAGIAFLVTGTNFSPGGFPPATPEQVAQLAEVTSAGVEIVFNGEVKSKAQVMEYFRAGASRICTPDAVKLLNSTDMTKI